MALWLWSSLPRRTGCIRRSVSHLAPSSSNVSSSRGGTRGSPVGRACGSLVLPAQVPLDSPYLAETQRNTMVECRSTYFERAIVVCNKLKKAVNCTVTHGYLTNTTLWGEYYRVSLSSILSLLLALCAFSWVTQWKHDQTKLKQSFVSLPLVTSCFTGKASNSSTPSSSLYYQRGLVMKNAWSRKRSKESCLTKRKKKGVHVWWSWEEGGGCQLQNRQKVSLKDNSGLQQL